MKTWWLVAVIALTLAPVAARAQQSDGAVDPMVQDTPPPGPGMMLRDTARMRMLRERIEQRFGGMVQQELQLSDPQMQQLRGAMRAHQERRRELALRAMAVNQAIRFQLRPGVAADRDSLGRLLEAQTRLRVEHAQQEERLQRELGFLNPVQRARFMQMERRFEEQVQDIIRHRQMQRMGGGFGGQGARPGPWRRPMNPPPDQRP
jgi:hypothetical protein